jgi:hypothetical protein
MFSNWNRPFDWILHIVVVAGLSLPLLRFIVVTSFIHLALLSHLTMGLLSLLNGQLLHHPLYCELS